MVILRVTKLLPCLTDCAQTDKAQISSGQQATICQPVITFLLTEHVSIVICLTLVVNF